MKTVLMAATVFVLLGNLFSAHAESSSAAYSTLYEELSVDWSGEVTQESDIETEKGYYFACPRSANEFMTATVVNDNPKGLGKTTDISEAGVFYFEDSGESDGKYYIYTYTGTDSEKTYLNFTYVSGDNASVTLGSKDSGSTVTVSYVSESSGNYLFSFKWDYSSSNSYYINKFGNISGSKFACWKGKDNGSYFTITAAGSDPLGINGKSIAIARLSSSDNYALSAETATTTTTGRMNSAGLNAASDYYYETGGEESSAMALWTFSANDDGSYYLKSGSSYLNISGSSLTVSDQAQALTVIPANGYVYIFGTSSDKSRMTYSSGFTARCGSGVSVGDADKFSLLTKVTDPVIVYDLSKSAAEADPDTTTTFPTSGTGVNIVEWTESYTLPACEYKSYGEKMIWTYTLVNWVDEDGNEYTPGDTLAEPSSVLYLTAEWDYETEYRMVTVEYYNDYYSETDPIETRTVDLSDSTTYKVLGFSDNTYYSESNGKKYEFQNWETDTGLTVSPGNIDLTDLSYCEDDGDDDTAYDTIRLRAVWETLADPWEIDGSTFVIINDRYGASDYSSSTRFYAMQDSASTSGSVKGFGRNTVSYDSSDNSCITTDGETPGLWTFTAVSSGDYAGAYYISNSEGKYLSIGSNSSATLSDSEVPLWVLYSEDEGKYVILNSAGTVALDHFSQDSSKLFSAWTNTYAKALENINETFYLAEMKGSVIYDYPEYSGTYPDGTEAPPSDAENDLPSALQAAWSSGYAVEGPSQSTYTAYTDDYIWTYTFDHWEDSDGNAYDSGDELSAEPQYLLELYAVWEFTGVVPVDRTVNYEVHRAVEGSDKEAPVDSLPGVSGLYMTSNESGNNLYYTAGETVSGSSVTEYSIRGLSSDTYISANGKNYMFAGWEKEDGSVISDLSAAADLTGSDFDSDGDKTVTLTATWTYKYEDPWGIDGMSYMIVYNDAYAVGSTAVGSSGNNIGLNRYAVTKYTGTDDEYEDLDIYSVSSGSAVVWTFDAQSNGTYILSTEIDGTVNYLMMNPITTSANSNSNIYLTTEQSNATPFMLFKYDDQYIFAGIGSSANTDSVRSLLDYYSAGLFSGWGKNTSTRPDGNNLFTLGVPSTGTIIYSYPEYEEPDTGTSNDLPSPTSDSWVTGYTAKQPSQTTYHSWSSNYKWTYTFTKWRVKDSATEYLPDDSIADPVGVLELEAVWEKTSVEEIEVTVKYNLNYTGTPEEEPDYTKVDITDDQEVVEGADVSSYNVAGLDPEYYKTSDGHVYEFMGWYDVNGDVIEPDSFIDLSGYGADSLTFTAIWSNTYTDGRSRETKFYLSTKALSADPFDDNAEISTNSSDFTSAIHYSLMQPGDMASPSMYYHEGINQTVYPLVAYYNGATDITIAEADTEIRELGSGGIVKDDTTFTLVDFPSDEDVLANLRELAEAGQSVTLDGVAVSPESITEENFTIRWYVCKLQYDGWHIDGKLTPNISYLRVEKNFAGDETALENIPDDFTIKVTTPQSTSEYIINKDNDSSTELSLVLDDQSDNKESYGLIDGNQIKGTFGYIESDADSYSYTWLIPTVRGLEYEISEENYSVTVDSVKYGIAAQYSVTNAQSGTDTGRVDWFGTVSGYAATYPRTSIDINNSTQDIQTVNLYNTYVELGTFVIQKLDVGTDGNGDEEMPGVDFTFYDVTDPDDPVQVYMQQKTYGKDGTYSLMYESGETVDVATTGSDGNIYLSIPKQSEGTERQFKVVETVPDGYQEGDEAPSFEFSVDGDGNFSEIGTSYVKPGGDYSYIKPYYLVEPGASDGSGVFTGVTVGNMPEVISIDVSKVWLGSRREDTVAMKLSGKTDGTTRITDEQTFTASSSETTAGTYEWSGMPLMLGNVKVDYSIEETMIGSYTSTSATFRNNWQQTYNTTYLDENGASVDDGTDVRQIRFIVYNDDLKDYVRLYLKKTDNLSTSNLVAGAAFKIYMYDSSSSETINYNGTAVKVTKMTTLTSSKKAKAVSWNYIYDSYYYLKETETPTGFESNDGWIRIHVDSSGNVELAAESSWDDEDLDVEMISAREGYLIIQNTRTYGRKVILRKVDSTYGPKESVTMTVYGADDDTAFDTGTEVLEDLESEESGVFWIGDLTYGNYLIEETSGSEDTWYFLIVDDDGVINSGSSDGNASTGYSSRAKAKAAMEDAG